ncbi:MAG TPA: lytic transglycosylase domain-containing protein [bacterium]|nr:lytic transglycosylase domain-containing protein [bacterium]
MKDTPRGVGVDAEVLVGEPIPYERLGWAWAPTRLQTLIAAGTTLIMMGTTAIVNPSAGTFEKRVTPSPAFPPAVLRARTFKPSGSRDIDQYAHGAARKFGVPYWAVRSILDSEDSGQESVSPQGAIGVGQLMPATAQALGVDPRDPQQNVEGTTAYIAQLYKRFDGDWDKVAAAYNTGPDHVASGKTLPDETVDFLRKFRAARKKYDAAQMAASGSAGHSDGISSSPPSNLTGRRMGRRAPLVPASDWTWL